NLSDGSCLLVSSFGDPLRQGDKFGILLNLTQSEMKVYFFLNDKPLGLAFHLQAPYPKPLFPIVGFTYSGKATITRSQQIPTSLDRQAAQFTDIEGHWKLVDYPQHSDCTGFKFHLFKQEANTFSLSTSVINHLSCKLQYDPSTNKWHHQDAISTMMGGDSESMRKEGIINHLIAHIQTIEPQGQKLVITSTDGDKVVLERYTPDAPQAHTKNVFSNED
ncbi:unnamed protein product, partial [Didymodactylos carnosus]